MIIMMSCSQHGCACRWEKVNRRPPQTSQGAQSNIALARSAVPWHGNTLCRTSGNHPS
jgi:hypothetical protein